jgi:hypothetical protein
VPVDHEATGVGDLAKYGRLHVPLGRHREEALELLRGHDRHHPLLALRHEDLLGRERGVAQQDLVELDEHPAIAVARQLGGRAADSGCSEVLDSLDELVAEELEAALDEHLLRERVSDLDGRALGRASRRERV